MSQLRDQSAHMSEGERRVRADRALLAGVARAYYLEDLSRVDIAERFGVSRFKVARLLNRARAEGVVTIEIHDRGLPDPILGDRLCSELRLKTCRVIRSHGDDQAVRKQVGSVGAAFLEEILKPGEVLGLSWGRTLTATTSQLEQLPRVSIVQLTGVVAGDLSASPLEVVRHASQRSGGDVYPIFAPLVIEDLETANSLRRHPDIRAAVDLFPSLTTAVLSVGAWDPAQSQIRDVLSDADRRNALDKGCVADIAGMLIREDGALADPGFQERCISISYDQLRRVPRVVAVAGGAAKARAIRAVSGAGLITDLVTDDSLAMAVLGGTDG